MKRDLYSEVTARILAELERGAAPWIKPWSATPGINHPYNARPAYRRETRARHLVAIIAFSGMELSRPISTNHAGIASKSVGCQCNYQARVIAWGNSRRIPGGRRSEQLLYCFVASMRL
jgi:N-terminal domain of anti-restriction factor ArdC